MSGIAQIGQLLRQLLPPEVAAVVLAVLVALMAPAWLRQIRAKQVRGALRAAARAPGVLARDAAIATAFERAGSVPHRLIALAEEASRLELVAAWERAVALLDALPDQKAEARRLLELRAPASRPSYTHPLAAALAVQAMLEAGLTDEATTRLHEARTRFPNDPDLAALEEDPRLRRS